MAGEACVVNGLAWLDDPNFGPTSECIDPEHRAPLINPSEIGTSLRVLDAVLNALARCDSVFSSPDPVQVGRIVACVAYDINNGHMPLHGPF